MRVPVRYDESFERLAEAVESTLGLEALVRGVVLREAAGRLAFVCGDEITQNQKEALSLKLADRLGLYAREDRVLVESDSPGAKRLLDERPARWLRYHDRLIRCVDRRIVGADWIGGPLETEQAPPRFVFSSLKGGVGRSTALCIVASELARRGKNVLVIDLDLEAPGVGSFLLPTEAQPDFGTIDYLAEACLSRDLSELVPRMIGTSPLTSQGGRIDVVPAVGRTTRPEHFLGKLSQAMLDAAPEGTNLTLKTKAAQLVDQVVDRSTYDVVLVDARAGLSEITAAPLLGLGATVLLFGTAQQQTIDGFRFLFAHLASLVPPEQASPWEFLQMVQAKATADEATNQWYLEELHSLFEEHLYEEQENLEGFNFDITDPDAPHYPVAVAMNPLFATWDPARRPTDLSQVIHEASFAPLVLTITRRLRGVT